MRLELAGHWWDQTWATLWRRDIWLHTDGVNWVVELRRGDASRRLWSRVYEPQAAAGTLPTAEALQAAETAARDYVVEVMARNPDAVWRDIYMPPRVPVS